jgi:hypothetical protein
VIFPIFSYTFQIEAETCVSASKSFMRFFMSNSIGLYIQYRFVNINVRIAIFSAAMQMKTLLIIM